MAIRYRSNCKACRMVKYNPKLRARMYKAAYRREDGDETIGDIADDVGLVSSATYNHVKKHMHETKPTGSVVAARRIEEVKQAVAKQLEVSLDHDQVIPKQDFEMALDAVIATGLSELNKGTTRVTVNQLIAASKVKGDFSSKRRGQDVEIVKTMYRSMNGVARESGQLAEQGTD